ncbi:DUF3263 domain-containing protein [Catellatospora citrea]|uniref:DUF3263 domain-containing protein n=1 Tax=Catellatospora citrea TaxID=53366 RepID=A0A8J3KIY1_9ACTN|nr:DUF3263 domain-containing protein [Catellatospora citrea]RKE08571.1 uncharacterized protein DUF3263 [Catellatospora citrea]GIG01700.1 hypothetical protein Cci01nite_67930 [Catellatospora citrea]
MEQIRQRSRADGSDLEELPLIPVPRRESSPVDLIPPAERDDEVDSDLPAAVVVTEDEALSERDRHILAFEKQWWRHAGAKEQAIRDQFEVSATRYYQLLNALLDNPAALEREPVLVGRLRRLRGSRARTRSTR